MKRAGFLCAPLLMICVSLASAQESAFDGFLTKCDYETRADMKIDSKRPIALLGLAAHLRGDEAKDFMEDIGTAKP